jgi:L-threonylcarbamoyladenylate synthase
MSNPIFDEINNAVEVLNAGGIILYPTDTVWGIGCDATKPEAIQKIIDLKKRDAGKSFIVLVDIPSKLNLFVEEVPAVAWDLVEFAEHPLTIVYPGAKNLAPLVIAADGSAAIRVVQDEFCQKLIQKLKKPLVSTSCNHSGEPTAINFDEIPKAILDGVDYIVNLRQNEKINARPSTIIKFEPNGVFKFLRK